MSERKLRGENPPSQDEIDAAAAEMADVDADGDTERDGRFAWEESDVTIEPRQDDPQPE